MCFSASSSFTISAVLATTGTYLICKKKPKRFIPLALIPLFFAIQQLSEGMIWLNILKEPHNPISIFSKNIFLFFAYVFWPLWIPFSLWAAESNLQKKQIMAFFIGIGLVISSLLFLLIPFTDFALQHKSIHYFLRLQNFGEGMPLYNFVDNIFLSFYAISITLPFLLSSLKKIWIAGAIALISGILIFLIDRLFFVSMWCFFAAIISLCLVFVLKNDQPKKI